MLRSVARKPHVLALKCSCKGLRAHFDLIALLCVIFDERIGLSCINVVPRVPTGKRQLKVCEDQPNNVSSMTFASNQWAY